MSDRQHDAKAWAVIAASALANAQTAVAEALVRDDATAIKINLDAARKVADEARDHMLRAICSLDVGEPDDER